jgi:hypothetical protein
MLIGSGVAAVSCGDDGMIGSSSAIVPHPCEENPLLSEGGPDKGPSENPVDWGFRGRLGMTFSVTTMAANDRLGMSYHP